MEEENKKEIIEIEKTEQESKTVEKKVEKKEEPKPRKKGLCIASMVLGIVTLVLFCVWYISIPCGILAIVFGALGVKTIDKGMAIAGIVTGAIGLFIAFCILLSVFTWGFIAALIDDFDDIESSTRNHHSYYNRYYN